MLRSLNDPLPDADAHSAHKQKRWLLYDDDMDTMCVESTNPMMQMDNKLLSLPNGEHIVLQGYVKRLVFVDDHHMPNVDIYGTQQPIALLKLLLEHNMYTTYDCDGDLAMDLCVHDDHAQRGVPVDTAHVSPFSADVQKQKKLHQKVNSFEFELTTITRRTARIRRSPCT